MTVSIGASGLGAINGRDSATPEMLLELADQYLYKSKKAGRNRATIPNVVDEHFGNGRSGANRVAQA
jgi:predicted signal transduction protein with EAL and GGDEF domain